MSNGKGKGPIKGYNYKKWYNNYDGINWHNKWCPMCGKWTDHLSGAHFINETKKEKNGKSTKTSK